MAQQLPLPLCDNSDKVSQNLPIQLHAVNLNDKSYVYRMVKQTNLAN